MTTSNNNNSTTQVSLINGINQWHMTESLWIEQDLGFEIAELKMGSKL